MKKYFDAWNHNKKKIDRSPNRAHFKEREIWYVSFGTNVGSEEDGKGDRFLRPAVFVKKFNNEIGWIVPLTTTLKYSRYYFVFSFTPTPSAAILSQLRLIDVKRLSHKIGVMSKEDFTILKKNISALLR